MTPSWPRWRTPAGVRRRCRAPKDLAADAACGDAPEAQVGRPGCRSPPGDQWVGTVDAGIDDADAGTGARRFTPRPRARAYGRSARIRCSAAWSTWSAYAGRSSSGSATIKSPGSWHTGGLEAPVTSVASVTLGARKDAKPAQNDSPCCSGQDGLVRPDLGATRRGLALTLLSTGGDAVRLVTRIPRSRRRPSRSPGHWHSRPSRTPSPHREAQALVDSRPCPRTDRLPSAKPLIYSELEGAAA